MSRSNETCGAERRARRRSAKSPRTPRIGNTKENKGVQFMGPSLMSPICLLLVQLKTVLTNFYSTIICRTACRVPDVLVPLRMTV